MRFWEDLIDVSDLAWIFVWMIAKVIWTKQQQQLVTSYQLVTSSLPISGIWSLLETNRMEIIWKPEVWNMDSRFYTFTHTHKHTHSHTNTHIHFRIKSTKYILWKWIKCGRFEVNFTGHFPISLQIFWHN